MAPSRDAIERSLSWRIIAPLRALGKPMAPLLQRFVSDPDRPTAPPGELDRTASAQLAASLATVRSGSGPQGVPVTSMADLSPEEARLCVAGWHDLLRAFHARLQPHAYLEIGVLGGSRLRLADSPVVGVDPALLVTQAEFPTPYPSGPVDQ